MTITKTIMAASVIAVAGYAGVASAHPYQFALGVSTTNVARTDIFGIDCNVGTAKISYQVKDVKTTPEKTTILKIRAASTQAGLASAVWYPADQLGNYTALKYITNGANIYYFEINKNAVAGVIGTETYIAQIHCLDANGGHNPDDQSPTPDLWIKRNQP